jgi:hypothetical protein
MGRTAEAAGLPPEVPVHGSPRRERPGASSPFGSGKDSSGIIGMPSRSIWDPRTVRGGTCRSPSSSSKSVHNYAAERDASGARRRRPPRPGRAGSESLRSAGSPMFIRPPEGSSPRSLTSYSATRRARCWGCVGARPSSPGRYRTWQPRRRRRPSPRAGGARWLAAPAAADAGRGGARSALRCRSNGQRLASASRAAGRGAPGLCRVVRAPRHASASSTRRSAQERASRSARGRRQSFQAFRADGFMSYLLGVAAGVSSRAREGVNGGQRPPR